MNLYDASYQNYQNKLVKGSSPFPPYPDQWISANLETTRQIDTSYTNAAEMVVWAVMESLDIVAKSPIKNSSKFIPAEE
jgi:hypothetical protein